MPDLLFLAVVVAFFALATLLVRACDRLVGPDAEVVGAPVDEAEPERIAA